MRRWLGSRLALAGSAAWPQCVVMCGHARHSWMAGGLALSRGRACARAVVAAISSRGHAAMGVGMTEVVLVLDGGGGALHEELPKEVAGLFAAAWWPVWPTALGCLPSGFGMPD